MLVLSRKAKETIVINGNITVQILDIRGLAVRVGITAPPEVTIHRGEVQQVIDSGVCSTREAAIQQFKAQAGEGGERI